MNAFSQARKSRPAPLLVDAAWVERRLDDSAIRLIDVRGTTAHRAGHLPGAAAVWWDSLVDPVDGSLANAATFAGAMSNAGVGDDHVVIVYDQHEPTTALRLVWALRRFGHDAAFALAGGAAAWIAQGRPLSRETVAPTPASFTARAPVRS